MSRTLALIAALSLTSCSLFESLPPCPDAACTQMRAAMAQQILANMQQNTIQQNESMWRVVQPPVHNFSCITYGYSTQCQ